MGRFEEERPRRALIAGYTDLTPQDFVTYYHEKLDKAIEHDDSFLLAAKPGACTMPFEYLKSKAVCRRKITINQGTAGGRDERHLYEIYEGARIRTVPGGDADRMAAMSDNSDYDILWLRPGDTLKDQSLNAIGMLKVRSNGPKEAAWLRAARGIEKAMAFYNEIV